MSGSMRLVLWLALLVFGSYIAISILKAIIGSLLSLLGPILFVGVVATVLYLVLSRKALGGGRRLLP